MKCRLPLIASKKGKASDNNGIRAEDIKTCDDRTKEMIRQIFNEVMKQEDCTPETWRRIRIQVTYKKGKVEEVGTTARFALCQRCTNCLQHSYTTDFTTGLTVLNQRTGKGRRSYQTLDHLATYRLLEQKCRRKWCITMRVATVDFMKALDSTSHQSLWKALESVVSNHITSAS